MRGNTTHAWSPSSAKLAVTFAAGCMGILWFLLAIWLLIMVVILLGVLSGYLPTHVSVSLVTMHIFLGCVGLFICCGSIYLVFALRLRCPNCGFKFLKNPKGLGPVGFVYHPNCARK